MTMPTISATLINLKIIRIGWMTMDYKDEDYEISMVTYIGITILGYVVYDWAMGADEACERALKATKRAR